MTIYLFNFPLLFGHPGLEEPFSTGNVFSTEYLSTTSVRVLWFLLPGSVDVEFLTCRLTIVMIYVRLYLAVVIFVRSSERSLN